MSALPVELPGLPRDRGEPVFDEPWQAQVFAITLALHENGVVGWTEWTQRLGAAIADGHAQGDPDDGSAYYRHWLTALEQLLVDRDIARPLTLTALRQAWRLAAESTPHGQPVRLGPAARARLGGGGVGGGGQR